MAVKTNAQLAAFFNTGDQPSEAEFGHLIDTIIPTNVLLTDADTTLTEADNAHRINILPDLSANRTYKIPTPSAAGVWYRFIYGGAAADTDNHIIQTVTTDNSVFFAGSIAHLDTNADNVAVLPNGSSNSKFTSTDTAFLDVTFWAFSTTKYYLVGSVISATAPAFADQ